MLLLLLNSGGKRELIFSGRLCLGHLLSLVAVLVVCCRCLGRLLSLVVVCCPVLFAVMCSSLSCALRCPGRCSLAMPPYKYPKKEKEKEKEKRKKEKKGKKEKEKGKKGKRKKGKRKKKKEKRD